MSKLTIVAQRKAWKADSVSIESIILGFFDVERTTTEYFEKAVIAVLGNNCTTLDQFQKLIAKANSSVLQTEMDERLALATTASEIKGIKSLFIHSKTTKQHKEGTFKTSILPNGWRTAVSIIGSCLTLGIPLYTIRAGEYLIHPKSVLDKLIKAKKAGESEEKDEGSPTSEKGAGPTSETGDKDSLLPPLGKLEAMVNSMRHILAELDDEQEIAMAKVMLESVWDLTPMKAAVNA